MRIAIATVQVPFIQGGAESLALGLLANLRAAGHEADIVTLPARFHPLEDTYRSMQMWQDERLDEINGYHVDRVITLKFPAFYVQHPNKVAWMLHQHREVYELWNTKFCDGLRAAPGGVELKRAITEADTAAFRSHARVYAISREVANRLKRFNGVPATPLYHPPPSADRIYAAEAEPYIYFPSRLEELKRQSLLIEAMRYVKTPVVALIAGDGGQRAKLDALIAQHGLDGKVRMLGRISGEEMLAYYAHALGVFFGPYLEDLGYVTLEAMLAHKPVITCTDSGGPLEFVLNGDTGLVVAPEPQAVADAIDRLYLDRTRAAAMGAAGAARYKELNISWEHACAELTA